MTIQAEGWTALIAKKIVDESGTVLPTRGALRLKGAGIALTDNPMTGETEAEITAGEVPTVDSYAALRAIPSTTTTPRLVRGAEAIADGAQGLFITDPASTSADDGGTVLKPDDLAGASPGRRKRVFSGPIDARWFGNLSLDAHAAITAALAAANSGGGGVVSVPSGSYPLASQLDLTNLANVTLRGEGRCELRFTVADVALGGGTVTDCALENLTLTGTAARMIALSTATRCAVRGCNVSGATLDGTSHEPAGIWLSGTTDCSVEGCNVSGNGRQKTFTADAGTDTFTSAAHGFLLNDQVHVFAVGAGTLPTGLVAGTVYHVINPTGSTFQLSATEGGAAIDITDSGAGTLKASLIACDIFAEFTAHTRLHINRNNCVSSQTVVGILVENATDAEVSANIVYGVSGSRANDGYGICISKTTTSERVAVVGNIVRDCAGTGVYFRGSAKCTAVGNVISLCAQTQDDTTLNVAGIAATNGPHTFTGNQIYDSGSSGISWSGACVVTGNHVDTCTKNGIWARGATAAGSVISGNRVTSAGVRGIFSDTAVSSVVVTGNEVAASGNNGIDFVAGLSGGIVSKNVVTGSTAKGIVVDGGSFNVISQNVVNGAGDTGIYATCADTEIGGNRSTGCTGKGLASSGARCDIHDNNLTGNTSSGYTVSGTNTRTHRNRFTQDSCEGVASLNGASGTVTVTTTEVRTGDHLRLTRLTAGGAPGHIYQSTLIDATSVVIASSSATDNGDVLWEIVH